MKQNQTATKVSKYVKPAVTSFDEKVLAASVEAVGATSVGGSIIPLDD